MGVLRRSARYRVRCVYFSYLATQLFTALGAPTLSEFCYCVLFVFQWVGFCSFFMSIFTFLISSLAGTKTSWTALHSAFIELGILLVPLGVRVMEQLSSSDTIRIVAMVYVAKLLFFDAILPWVSILLKYILRKYPVTLRVCLMIGIVCAMTWYYPEAGIAIAFTIFAIFMRVDQLAQGVFEGLVHTNTMFFLLSLSFSFSVVYFPQARAYLSAIASSCSYDRMYKLSVKAISYLGTSLTSEITMPCRGVTIPFAKRQWSYYTRTVPKALKRLFMFRGGLSRSRTAKVGSPLLDFRFSYELDFGVTMIRYRVLRHVFGNACIPVIGWLRTAFHAVPSFMIQASTFAASYYARRYRIQTLRVTKQIEKARHYKPSYADTRQSVPEPRPLHASLLSASGSRESALKEVLNVKETRLSRTQYAIAVHSAAARAGPFLRNQALTRKVEKLENVAWMRLHSVEMLEKALDKLVRQEKYRLAWHSAAARAGSFMDCTKLREKYDVLKTAFEEQVQVTESMKKDVSSKEQCLREELCKEREAVVTLTAKLQRLWGYLSALKHGTIAHQPSEVTSLKAALQKAEERVMDLQQEAEVCKTVYINGISDLQTIADHRRIQILDLEARLNEKKTTSLGSVAPSPSSVYERQVLIEKNHVSGLSRRITQLKIELEKAAHTESGLKGRIATQMKEMEDMKVALRRQKDANEALGDLWARWQEDRPMIDSNADRSGMSLSETLASSSGLNSVMGEAKGKDVDKRTDEQANSRVHAAPRLLVEASKPIRRGSQSSSSTLSVSEPESDYDFSNRGSNAEATPHLNSTSATFRDSSREEDEIMAWIEFAMSQRPPQTPQFAEGAMMLAESTRARAAIVAGTGTGLRGDELVVG